MTDKEQIIINGKEKYCKILFRCKHIDDLEAYNMISNGIKITPENAPVSDFELMLIEKTSSPFGFSSICKRNNKEDVWEYSGFGHSGAASIVTALLKQLTHKTQECEELKEKYKWYEHYKKAALYNKDLCNKKSDEIACYKQTLKKIKKIVSNMSSYTAREERQIEQILQACEVLCGGK